MGADYSLFTFRFSLFTFHLNFVILHVANQPKEENEDNGRVVTEGNIVSFDWVYRWF